ncbi:MAG: hypothetical protein VKI42_04970 [Synechococcaceae cyanobacterium]|nr:hypothetical protein [Synechococcaceae cyanobacterium]
MATSVAILTTMGIPKALAIPAFTFKTPPSPTGESLTNPPFTLGWSFNVSPGKSFVVDALGAFDSNGDGLASSHDIGLWDGGGNLLASVLGVTGDSLPLVDNFRYKTLTSPVTLSGGTYYVGATWLDGTDPNTFPGDILELNFVDGINFRQNQFVAGALLAFPGASTGPSLAYYGPNVDFRPAPAPLPVLGAAAAFGYTRKLRRRVKGSQTAVPNALS